MGLVKSSPENGGIQTKSVYLIEGKCVGYAGSPTRFLEELRFKIKISNSNLRIV